MEYFFKQLQRLREATSFDAQKKAQIRVDLVNYIKAEQAVRGQAAARHNTGKRSVKIINAIFNMKVVRFAAPIAVLVLLGSGTSFAAASALPGDPLYPVKVGVNEKIAASFQFTPQQKAEFDAFLAERRLAEANELAAKGRLNAKASAEVEGAFQNFADRVQARVNELRQSGNEEAAAAVSARFEAALEAHARALAAMQAKFEDEDGDNDSNATSSEDNSGKGRSEAVLKLSLPVKAALQAMRDRDDDDMKGDARSSAAVGGQVAATVRLQAAAEAIADAREALAKDSSAAGAEAAAKANAELDAADALLVRAKAQANAGEYVNAIKLANQAAQSANQVRVLLKLQVKVNAAASIKSDTNGKSGLDLFDRRGRGSDDAAGHDAGDDRGTGKNNDGAEDGSDASGVRIDL